ncbi:peptidoglycan-binding protein [Cellulomonas sp. P22]|uniref:peptidoglycan-binding protein n=1 Tax=Cellulomonas sp. P22 TaxID=3373189 RepID=UPI0037884100
MQSTPPSHARVAAPHRSARWVALVVVAASAAFVAGALLSPTARRDPATRSPDPTTVTTAVVERRAWEQEVPVLRGTLRGGSVLEVAVPTLAAPVERSVVTSAPADVGTVVSSGDLLVGVSGRPIIALSTSLPLFRSLHPGDTGDDVWQVQRALADLGLYTDEVDGVYGPRTAEAVAALYSQVGFTTPEPDAERAEALSRAQEAWDDVELARRSAADDPDPAAGPADEVVERARRELRRAQDAAGTWLPLDEVTQVPDAGAMVTRITPLGTVLPADQTSVAELVGGTPVLTVRADAALADDFRVGAEVQVNPAAGGDGARGVVERVAPTEGAATLDVVVAVPAAAESGLADGAQIAVTPARRPPTAELVVPVAAVHQDSRGRYVLVPDPAGSSPTRLAVDVGEQRDGFVAVLADGLAEGDEILVGATAPPGGTG